MTPIDKDQRLKLAVQKSGRLTDPSLDLLKSCGLKLSRGRDQLMGFGENMPLDVLFVRDDDIPDLVQEDVCDLGLVGRNVLEEKRLELISRGPCRHVHRAAHARLRPLPPVARGARRASATKARVRSPANVSPPPIRSRSNVTCANATSRPTSSRCRAPWRSRRGSAAPISSAISCRRVRRCRPITCAKWKPCSRARRCSSARRWRCRPRNRNGSSACCCASTACSRCKESKYIMLHAPRSALPEIRRLLPGSESPTIIPLEGLQQPGRDSRGVPRERVLGNAREPQEGRREFAAGAAGREDAGLK